MPMKSSVLLFLLMAGMLASGCIFHKQKTSASVPKAASVIITPDASLAGKVISYNDAGRFVVLNFPVGRMPEAGQNLFLYRNGLKVAEVKTDRGNTTILSWPILSPAMRGPGMRRATGDQSPRAGVLPTAFAVFGSASFW